MGWPNRGSETQLSRRYLHEIANEGPDFRDCDVEGLGFVTENPTFYKAPQVILVCVNYVWKLRLWRVSKVVFNLSSQLFCVYCHDYIDKHPTKKEGKIKLALGVFTRASTFPSLPFRGNDLWERLLFRSQLCCPNMPKNGRELLLVRQ